MGLDKYLYRLGDSQHSCINKVKEFYDPWQQAWLDDHQVMYLHSPVNGTPNLESKAFEPEGWQKLALVELQST